MRDGTAIQRLAALRRRLGALASPPRWLERSRARRLARLEQALAEALPLDAELAPEVDPKRAGARVRRDLDRLG